MNNTMNLPLVSELRRQNRLLKAGLTVAVATLAGLGLLGAKSPEGNARFDQIDVRRINLVNADGRTALMLASHGRIPDETTIGGRTVTSDRREVAGMIFFGSNGDEVGGLIYDAKPGADGKPHAGVHLSMDRYGGDQQLALHHYEGRGSMETGLSIYDRGLEKDYGPIWEEYLKTPDGPEKDALRQRWKEAGGQQITRLFVGRTRGQSPAVILADDQGRPRLMMLVTPDGQPSLQFIDEHGEVLQSLPQQPEED